MKKSTFKISLDLNNGSRRINHRLNKEVSGLVSDNFGIHKNEAGFFILTHLPTGLLLRGFNRQSEAVYMAMKLENEKFPVSWSCKTLYELSANSAKFNEIRKELKTHIERGVSIKELMMTDNLK